MTSKNKAVNIVLFSSICALLQACGGGGTNDGSINVTDVSDGTTALTDEPSLGEALGESLGESLDETLGAEPTAVPTDNTGTENTEANIPVELASSFSSASTDGFSGEILNDGTVALEWEAQRGARGYNVYRDGEYIETVFDDSYQDDNLDAGGYYYEIIAFDNNDQFELIADALTVYLDVPTADQATAQGTLPEHVASDYTLVFAEEFDTDTLNPDRWNTSYLWGTDLFINSEEQYYVDIKNQPDFGYNPFKLNGETLTIEAIRTPDNLREKALGQPYLSGVITSYDSFQFTYGYVEARAKVPFGQGYWSAFWLLNAFYVDLRPEIDIMEHIGHDRDVVFHTYHYFDSEGNLRSTESMQTSGIDFTSEFHTYAVEWKPGQLIFYIDGIERRTVTDPNISAQDMYIIANTALGGWWPGSPDDSTVFPSKFEIDYIRAYQKTGLQFDFPPFDDGAPPLRFAEDVPGRSPNHIPSPDQWPEGYPELQ